MPRFLPVLLLAAASAAPALAATPARPGPLEEVPASLQPAVAKGEAAIDQLRDFIYKRLNAIMVQGGPAAAVGLCATEAPRLAKEVGEANGVDIGRTSFRVRNPANAPRPWAAKYVAAAAGKKADEVKPAVFDLGDRVGLLRPLAMMPACTRCHGPAAGLAPEVKGEIANRYPRDQATGFTPGELRGFFWVEVKKP
jgi:hypothetical protein